MSDHLAVKHVVSKFNLMTYRTDTSQLNKEILADVLYKEVLDFAVETADLAGNSRILDIIHNMRLAEERKYKTVTRKQEMAIASFLMDKFSSVSEILTLAYTSSYDKLFGEIELTNEKAGSTQGHTLLHHKENECVKVGDLALISENAFKNMDDCGLFDGCTMTAKYKGQLVLVTYSEFKQHNLKEVPIKKGYYQ